LILGAVFLMFYLVFRQENLQKKFIVYSLWFVVAAVLAFLPLGVYFLQEPADFMGRASDVSVFSQPNPVKALLVSLVSHLAMFNLQGDYNWRHNISGSPVLFWPVGLFFLVGLFVSFKELFNHLKNKKFSESSRWFFLLLLWGVMLLPGILSSEAVPHSLRTIGAIPGTFLLAGLGSAFLLEKLWRFAQRQSFFNFFILAFSLVLLLGSFALAEYGRYFNQWAQSSGVRDAFSTDLVEAGQYLNSLPDNVSKYVLVNLDGVLVDGIPMPAQTPIFVERARYGFSRAVYLRPEQLTEIKPEGKTVVVLLKKSEQIISELKLVFPSARVKERDNVLRLEI